MNRPARSSTGVIDAYLGAAFKARRIECGLTQDQVAGSMQALGNSTWSKATVAACETGRRNLSLTELSALCRTLGTTLPDVVVFPDDTEVYDALAPLLGWATTYVPTTEEAERYRRRIRLHRLEDSTLESVTGCSRTRLEEIGVQEHMVLAILSHYGHDLLTERDRRVSEGQGNKTWVSRRLADEVAQIPEVAELAEVVKNVNEGSEQS